MAVVVSAELVRDYFQACLARDPERLARFIDDDVTWAMTGPIDLLPFCGQWRGQTAVLNAIVRLAPKVIRLCDLEFEEILVDGDRAATFTRLSAIHAASGRNVSYRCAQFLRFRDGKLVEFRALIDSFDAAEQMLGHPIEVPAALPLRANLTPV